MKKQNKIFNKYMNLLVQVVRYTNSRNSNQISIEDIFVCLAHLFASNKLTNQFFTNFWIDLRDIIKEVGINYDFNKLSFLAIGVQNFILDKKVISLLESLEDIKDLDLFPLSLFLELLYEPEIISQLVTSKYFPIIQNLNVKELVDTAYNNEQLKLTFSNILDIKKVLKKEVLDTDINQILNKDDFDDFDLELEDDQIEDKKVNEQSWDKKDKLMLDTFW
jgi:hypothetical protein